MHHFVRAADVKPAPAFPKHSAGYRRFGLSDRSIGAVHTGWGLAEFAPIRGAISPLPR